MHVLVVEDNRELAAQIKSALEAEDFTVSLAHDGEEGHFLGETVELDAVVLDIGLPIMDGIYVLNKWRQAGIGMPVLILSARDSEADRRLGWSAGCEAYLTKPFLMWELVANLRALIRRSAGLASSVLRCGALEVDTDRKTVMLDGRALTLRPKVYQTLLFLLHHQGEAVARDRLLDHLYGWNGHPETNTIEVFIKDLRGLIGAEYIKTRRGFGYVLECPENDQTVS